ncbi:MAG: anhydro-N-acetylmuramic acid kinase [Gemmataceae bacterium]
MQTRLVIGLSSGASRQGTQAALVEANGAGPDLRLRLVHWLEKPYPAELRHWLWRSNGPDAGARTPALLHRVLGGWSAGVVAQLLEQAKVHVERVLCVGMNGQVIWHDSEGRHPTSLVLGMPEIVAEKTGLTIVSDFNLRDLAAGGAGMPGAPSIDHLVFGDAREDRLLVHLGGWASCLFLPAGKDVGRLAGFQAAPCGLLLDGLMRLLTSGKEPFDAWGKHAVQGRCIEPLLQRWLAHPTLERKPPRSLSLEDFGEAFIAESVAQARALERSLHDVLCTATHFVAHAIAQAATRFLPGQPGRVLLSGGGARNGFLLRLIEQQLQPAPVEKLERHGCPGEARHALGYAGLALLALDGLPGNVPAVSGAAGPRLLGSFTPGATHNWARCLGWMAQQTAPFHAAAA